MANLHHKAVVYELDAFSKQKLRREPKRKNPRDGQTNHVYCKGNAVHEFNLNINLTRSSMWLKAEQSENLRDHSLFSCQCGGGGGGAAQK